ARLPSCGSWARLRSLSQASSTRWWPRGSARTSVVVGPARVHVSMPPPGRFVSSSKFERRESVSENAVRGSRCTVAGVVSAAIKAGAPKAVLDAMRGEVAQHVADIESEVVAYSDRIRELEGEAE